MLFKDLKPGYPIYIYNKNIIEIQQGKITNVTPPHIDTKMSSGLDLVVDVTVNIDNVDRTYTFKDNTETGYVDSFVISTDKNCIIREIESCKVQSEEILSSIDQHKTKLEKYNKILAEFNPALKEKQQIENRFNSIESSVDEIKNMLKSMVNNNSKLITS